MASRNKTAQLVHALREEELSRFLRTPAVKARSPLALLFRYLRKNPQIEATAELKAGAFRAVFGKPYAAEEDYRLRHELRLLGEALRVFGTQLALEGAIERKDSEASRLYLRFLEERGLHQQWKTEALKLQERATRLEDFSTAGSVQKQRINQFIARREATSLLYRELEDMLLSYFELIGKAYQAHYYFGSHKLSFVRRTLAAIEGQTMNWDWPDVGFDPGRVADSPHAEFLRLMTLSYAFQGLDKIQILLQAQGQIQAIRESSMSVVLTRATTSASLALEYFLQGRFDEALHHHRDSLLGAEALPPSTHMAFRFNGMSILMRMERYADAIGEINQWQEVWDAIPKFRDRFRCLKAMCHLFLEQPDDALECIPANRKQGGLDHYYYYRLVHLIGLWVRGDALLALNETDNLEHTVRYQDKDVHYLFLVRHLRKYFRLRLEEQAMSRRDLKRHRDKLLEELDYPSWLREVPDKALPGKWLQEALLNLVSEVPD